MKTRLKRHNITLRMSVKVSVFFIFESASASDRTLGIRKTSDVATTKPIEPTTTNGSVKPPKS